MGAQRNVPIKQKVKRLKLTYLFLKKLFETLQDFNLSTANKKIEFSVLTFLSTKLRNTLVPNSLEKLMKLISLGLHIDDLKVVSATFLLVWFVCLK